MTSDRSKGSHVVLRRDGAVCVVSMHDELAVGTLRNVLRQAGVSSEISGHRREIYRYERIKDMTPEEEVAYFRAQNEPIIRQFNLKMSPLKPMEPRKRAKVASG